MRAHAARAHAAVCAHGSEAEAVAHPPAVPPRVFDRDASGSRSVYIRKAELEKFGYTAGCPTCDAQRAGLLTAGKNHTAECRLRLERAMEADPVARQRLEATRTRQAEHFLRTEDEKDRNLQVENGITDINDKTTVNTISASAGANGVKGYAFVTFCNALL